MVIVLAFTVSPLVSVSSAKQNKCPCFTAKLIVGMSHGAGLSLSDCDDICSSGVNIGHGKVIELDDFHGKKIEFVRFYTQGMNNAVQSYCGMSIHQDNVDYQYITYQSAISDAEVGACWEELDEAAEELELTWDCSVCP